ncbi:MAG: GFA family protein [Pseudomonadota bacterium]
MDKIDEYEGEHMQRVAACGCGEISITVIGPPVFSAICACTNCQKRTGSAFGMSAYYDRDKVLKTEGQPTVFRYTSNKDRFLDFRFCPTCGSTVWWEVEFMPDKIGVAGILFDDDQPFTADGAYFCATKPDWVSFDESIKMGQAGSTS